VLRVTRRRARQELWGAAFPAPRGALRAAAAVVCAAALLACGGCGARRLPARIVVLVSIDTARADFFGFMGNERVATPGLDAFAASSIVFDDCMTVVPTTLASHVSLMTGKYPHHHGTPRNGFTVNPENEMLAEILKRHGFRTAGFAGSFALDSRFGFAQGFDRYDEGFDVMLGQDGADQNQRRADSVTDAVIRYLDEEGTDGRLFLFVHYFDPHRPYDAPPPFDTLYDPDGRTDLPAIPVLRERRRIPPDDLDRLVGRTILQYASEISYVDYHLGRLLGDLDRRGLLDDALVVITSDHGECLWEHGEEFDHGATVYQATLHTLCVMRPPGGVPGGRKVEGVVANIDVAPTILSYLGLPVPEDADGEPVDLRAAVDSLEPRERFSEATKPWRDVETDPRWTNIRKARCVREGGVKFIQTPYRGTEELYDLVADPMEREDLLGVSSPDERLVPGLRATLMKWADSAAPLPSRFEPYQSEETRERLRSLGYLQ
jgi:arylsulfatase A-like enzyme